MRYILSLILSLTAITFTQTANAECGLVNAEPQKAENIYGVYRNGKKIGQHVIRFEKSGAQIHTEAETFMQVKLLFVSAFKYTYLSKEQWCGDNLMAAQTVTYSNGKDITSDVKPVEGGYVINADYDGEISNTHLYGSLVPSNHWNRRVLTQEALFDTVKAYAFDVTTVKSETANLPDFSGTRYDVTGDYEYSTYYNENDHWLGMSFYRGEKNFIEFRCEDCNNTLWPDVSVQN